MKVQITEIQIKTGRREPSTDHVRVLADSIRELGLLNPITIDSDHTLIAGLHRLEAVKSLGWAEVECTVSSLAGLQAELAEIDENFVRNGYSTLEYGEMLLRRKEIYEMIHPETKATYDGGQFKGNQHKDVVTEKSSLTTKSFVQDTADKLGVVPRTVELQIQTAKNLTPETKEIIRGADTKITKKSALKLSRLKPEQQQEAATLLAAKEIKSVDEYKAAKQPAPEVPPMPVAPVFLPSKTYSTFRESVAELKSDDTKFQCTPDYFVSDFSVFSKKFQTDMKWYSTPDYEAIFPYMSASQLENLQQIADSMHTAIETLLNRIERMQNNELQKESLSPKSQEA